MSSTWLSKIWFKNHPQNISTANISVLSCQCLYLYGHTNRDQFIHYNVFICILSCLNVCCGLISVWWDKFRYRERTLERLNQRQVIWWVQIKTLNSSDDFTVGFVFLKKLNDRSSRNWIGCGGEHSFRGP